MADAMRFLLFLLPLISAGQAFAAETEQPFATGSLFVQLIWGLLVVIGLILVLYAFAKKRFAFGNLKPGSIKILEMRHIMPKAGIALIEVRNRTFLLGIGNDRVELLADLSDTSSSENASSSFDAALAKEL